MAPRILIATQQGFSERDNSRFGVQRFVQLGLDVQVLDVSNVVFPHLENTPKSSGYPDRWVKISTRQELEQILQSFGSNDFALTYVTHTRNSNDFFNLLASRRIKTLLPRFAEHPCIFGQPPSVLSRAAKFLYKCLHTPRMAFESIRQRVCLGAEFVPPVDYLLLAGTAFESVDMPFKGSSTSVVHLHSFDYDRHIESIERTPSVDGEFILFLDEYLPFHPDYEILRTNPPLTASEYFPRLCEHFAVLEKRFNCPVVIAAHPKAAYTPAQQREFFAGRKILESQTPELVRESKLVVAHASTALSYAAINKKPTIVINSEIWHDEYYHRSIETVALELGAMVFLLERPLVPERIPDLSQLIPTRSESYSERFVGRAPIDPRPIPDLIAEFVQQNCR